MRPATAIGFVASATTIVGLVWLDQRTTQAVDPSRPNRADAAPMRLPDRTRADPPPVVATAPVPVRSLAPPAPPAIYRCRSQGTTTYSQDPCPGAVVVDPRGAVDGFDSRPSDALRLLVEKGRRREAPEPARVVGVATSAPETSGGCAILRRQVEDIDRLLRQPHDVPTLDEWRRRRQDVRTSMARQHC